MNLLIERNQEIIARRRRGESPRAIARTLGVSPGVVSGVLHRADIIFDHEKANLGQGSKRKYDDNLKAYAVAMLYRLGYKAASVKTGVSFSQIYQWRKELELRA
jgi:transposase